MWNPRYVWYAQAYSRSPENQLAHDKQEWVGGCMTGFILWIQDKWKIFRAIHRIELHMDQNKMFDDWMVEQGFCL